MKTSEQHARAKHRRAVKRMRKINDPRRRYASRPRPTAR